MVTPADLAVVGGAAGVGAVVGALMASAHVSLAGQQRWLGPVRPGPSIVVIDRQLIRSLQADGTPADGARALRIARPGGRPYDWARDGEAVA